MTSSTTDASLCVACGKFYGTPRCSVCSMAKSGVGDTKRQAQEFLRAVPRAEEALALLAMNDDAVAVFAEIAESLARDAPNPRTMRLVDYNRVQHRARDELVTLLVEAPGCLLVRQAARIWEAVKRGAGGDVELAGWATNTLSFLCADRWNLSLEATGGAACYYDTYNLTPPQLADLVKFTDDTLTGDWLLARYFYDGGGVREHGVVGHRVAVAIQAWLPGPCGKCGTARLLMGDLLGGTRERCGRCTRLAAAYAWLMAWRRAAQGDASCVAAMLPHDLAREIAEFVLAK